MRLQYTLLLLLMMAGVARLSGQEFPPEDICIPLGQGFITNVIDDNVPGGAGQFLTSFYESDCFLIDELGNLSFSSSANEDRCCGPQEPIFVTVFRVSPNGELEPIGEQEININVKCVKPDCGLVDLEEITQPDPDPNNEMPLPPNCIDACENSTATYLFNQTAGFAYDWMAVNGAPSFNPALPGQVTVSWGPLGGASLSVDIYDASGNLVETRTWCVDLTPAPVADFTFTPVACLDQEVYFTNTSSGAAATFDWNFGDGTTAQNVTNPSHAYSAPGTYSITLYATSSSTGADSIQGCCCTDSITYDIVVDPLPAPEILWISTLCEGDQSGYWTTAEGCSSFAWTVSGNGTIINGQGTDSITVDWGAGPTGTITLAVTDCDDDYCPQPSTAVVPIISSVGAIAGAVDVCKGETTTYELPKWMTVDYQWSTSDPAAVIVGNNGGHIVSVTWPTTPGTYQLFANYGSDFLAGLPGHSGSDCTGSAVLSVTVLGDFYINANPNPACFGSSSFLQGFSDIGSPTYNWTVAGFPGLSTTGATASITWPGPGIYTVTADVTNPDDYCIGTRSITVVVKDAVEPVITGPVDYCVGEPIVYQVASPTPGYDYNWAISGGTILLGNGGPTVTASFSVTSGASLSVVGVDQSPPNCASDPAVVNPVTKDFLGSPAITGPAPCTNSTATYGISVPQHPDATYAWSVSPITAGSVTGNADSANPTVTWNNGPGNVTLTVDIELCGQTLTLNAPLQLSTPVQPNIVQVGGLCPGGTVNLEVDGTPFSSVSWNNGMTGASITIGSPGNYVVNTVDLNGCPGFDLFTVEEADGPSATLSLAGNDRICVNAPPFPANPVLSVATGGANTIEWICNGVSQGAAATGNNTFTHVWSPLIGVYAYTAIVTDVNGCTTTPDPILIYQEPCCSAPYVSEPLANFHTFTAINRTPNCDIVDLVANWSADSVDCHVWDLPRYTTTLGGGGATAGNIANDSLTIRLPGVGCYKVESEISRWAYEYATTTVTDPTTGLPVPVTTKVDSIKCGEALQITVCNPLFAEFDYTENCGTVNFINESLVDLTLTSGPVTHNWDFGDGSGSSTLENPVYTYSANGVYAVTLVVSDGACESTFTFNVQVENLPDSDFTLSPNPVCYGETVSFFGTGTDVISWTWDFGNGAVFVGPNPQQTFLPAAGFGTSVVTLTTVNSGGCTDVVTQTIVINPAPADQVISASNGLIICEGTSTTLSVPFVAGHTYLWTNGATGNSITVNTAGSYGLTITTADDCTIDIDAEEVQIIPLPDASWFGNPFICDEGSTTLTASAGGGHTYEWRNITLGVIIPTRQYTVNYTPGAPVQDIALTVTNAFGCSATSFLQLNQVASPAPVLAITGGSCEGDGSTITVTNPEPDVVYTWSTGATGLSIFTYQAGAYTVLATNTISGCTGSALAVINPLPDLCLVPTGCYETCDPDTLYAPLGNYAYEWYDENGPLFDFDDSTVVTTSGQYYVTVMDLATGCVATSDPLILTVIDCDSSDVCDNLVTRLVSAATTTDPDCCYDLSYASLPSGVFAIRASSPDAALTATTVNPTLTYTGSPDPSTLEFAVDPTLTTQLPTAMTSPAVATICPSDVLASPQTLFVEYLAADGSVVCADTMETNCEPEMDCIYVSEDSLYCDETGATILEMTVCVPADLEYNIGFIQLMASSAAAMVALPINLNLSPDLLPGECRNLRFTLPDMTPGEDFCYTIVGHSEDPELDPLALCCFVDEPRCLTVPDCDPCDGLVAEGIIPVNEDGCCYDIYLFDGEPDFDFDRIDVCVLGGGATLSVQGSVFNPLVGTVNASGTTVSVGTASGSDLPDGEVFQLPRICLDGEDEPEYELEIKWINGDNVLCRDTVTVFCEPDCGYLEEELVVCEGDRYVWSGNIVNTSGYPMSYAYVSFPPASGLSAYNTSIDLGGAIPPGGVAFVNIEIGGPAGPGDTICFTVALHETNDDDDHLNCCTFEACIILPDCTLDDCSCKGFKPLVYAGVDTINIGPGPRDYLLLPRSQFSDCDVVQWRTRSRPPGSGWTPWTPLVTSYDFYASFPENIRYQVAMRVTRYTADGDKCSANTYPFYDFEEAYTAFGPSPELEVFPNPATDEVTLIDLGHNHYQLGEGIELLDMNGKQVRQLKDQVLPDGASRTIDLGGLTPGVYLLRGKGEAGVWTKKFVKQ